MSTENARAFPNGRCWCGCGERIDDPRVFFRAGHDKRAEVRVIRERYGDVASFLLAYGYGPAAGGGAA
ncbi:hypothetical protein FDG2_4253 [Candidatus Protofrankia californiensis]|uniref:Uncharacterized protein n=1 Tax=Candidatus Protofrankia californiensis TaxID=1839754 RepID=A0A1C3P4C2_9ACTN|nr:hypothetical protein FDG2_4253 [Candidatus Protofrankia californiensis]